MIYWLHTQVRQMDRWGEERGRRNNKNNHLLEARLCFRDLLPSPQGWWRIRGIDATSSSLIYPHFWHGCTIPPFASLIPPDSSLLSSRSWLCSGVFQPRPLQDMSLLTVNTSLGVNKGWLCVIDPLHVLRSPRTSHSLAR